MAKRRASKRLHQDNKSGAVPVEEWLDTAIRLALQTSDGNVEPPAMVWDKIRRRIASRPEVCTIGPGRCEMISWNQVMAQQERCKDLLREAERERTARQVLAGRDRRNRFYCQALTWLGDHLVTWGSRLQEQYGPAPAAVCSSSCEA
jgi:hypothetical protein